MVEKNAIGLKYSVGREPHSRVPISAKSILIWGNFICGKIEHDQKFMYLKKKIIIVYIMICQIKFVYLNAFFLCLILYKIKHLLIYYKKIFSIINLGYYFRINRV